MATILFDLDDTLLDNDMEKFLPHYLKALSQYIHSVPADKMIHELMHATEKMIAQSMPVATLEHTFDQYFYPGIGIPKDDLIDQLDYFYREVFPSLSIHTKPRQAAIRAVEYAFANNHRVIIATNPLFPRQATYTRLSWAGLSVEKYHFSLVSTYEDFHFSKPNLAYITEILAQTGWLEQSVVFIGDNLEDDILPAESLDIPTFWINPGNKILTYASHPLRQTGEVDEIIPWLKDLSFNSFDIYMGSPKVLIAILKSTPAALDTILKHAPKETLISRNRDDKRSVIDIVGHMCDEEREFYLPTLKTIINKLSQNELPLETSLIIQDNQANFQNEIQLLRDYIDLRIVFLKIIIDLPEEVFQKKLISSINGYSNLQDLLHEMAEKDRQQIRIIQNFLSLPEN